LQLVQTLPKQKTNAKTVKESYNLSIWKIIISKPRHEQEKSSRQPYKLGLAGLSVLLFLP